MEYREARSKKLSFKGESTSSKRSADSGATKRKAKKKRHRDTEGAATGWGFIESLDDLEGPIALYHKDEQLAFVLAMPSREESLARAESSEQTLLLHALSNESLADCVPSSVEQVFSVRRSVPTAGPADAEAAMYSLKSFTGTYLAADRHGRVSCASAAIGALEMWTPVLLPDRGDGAVAFMIRPPGATTDQFLSAADTNNPATERERSEATRSSSPVH
ncbi:hypothetical protein GGI21_005477, partial [Coemansia aciculifera]